MTRLALLETFTMSALALEQVGEPAILGIMRENIGSYTKLCLESFKGQIITVGGILAEEPDGTLAIHDTELEKRFRMDEWAVVKTFPL